MNYQQRSNDASPAPKKVGSIRTGADYLASLKNDGRSVYVEGERVKDVTTHPAFREAAKNVAKLYDLQNDPSKRELMTFTSPTTGQPVSRAFQIPRTHADLKAKRLASEAWSELSFGMMGRTPDHVSNYFCGYAAVPELFAKQGQQFADNVVKFYEHLRDDHQFITYAIVPPQIDRSKPGHEQSDPTLYAGVVKEKDGGIVVSGAQQLATGGVFSDYVYLSCIHPLRPGEENYAIGVAIPMGAEGVRLYPRRPFALRADNDMDYPLSSRFDESDCFVVLDNVFIPWEHVFIYRDLEVCRDQWWKTPAHSYGNLQAQARYITKLRFMSGLAKRMNEMTGNDGNPAVQVQMGELAAFISLVDGMLQAQEVMATVDDKGVLWPSKPALYSVMAMQSEFNPRMIDIIRELTGAAMISMPSSAKDFDGPVTGPDMERFMRSASTGAKERVALMRMAWDFIGTEFANRHQQYEKFYGGASFLVKQNMFRSYDFKRATQMVDDALKLPPTQRD